MKKLSSTLAITAPIVIGASWAAAGTFDVVARRLDPVPGGNGLLSDFEPPRLGASGAIVFAATLEGTSGGSANNKAIYRFNGTLTELVRKGQPTPLLNANYSSFSGVAVDSEDRVYFSAVTSGFVSGGNFRTEPDGSITQLVVEGQSLSDGQGTIVFVDAIRPGEGGHGVFSPFIPGGQWNAVRLHPDGAVTMVAEPGDVAPSGGTFNSINDPVISSAGDIAFSAQTLSPMFQFSQGIYFSRAADHELVTVVRSGDPLPDGPGTFGSFNTNPAINASGSLAFRSVNLHDTPGGAMDNAGVFLSDGRVITTIARRGALTPTGDGLLFEFPLEVLCLNDSGQVLFTASLAGTDGGSTDDSGLFLGDGTSLVEIAREGDPAPGGGAFTSFAALFGIPMALNNAGEVVFLCTLSGGVQAIMRWTHDEGLAVVVREGDVTPTGAIIALDFAGHADQFATPGSGLNDAGQIAFWFRTTGFSTGIGRWPAMLVGDLNGDGIVDGADLGQLLAAWGDVESMPEADLNEDGVINGADLGLLLAAWTG